MLRHIFGRECRDQYRALLVELPMPKPLAGSVVAQQEKTLFLKFVTCLLEFVYPVS